MLHGVTPVWRAAMPRRREHRKVAGDRHKVCASLDVHCRFDRRHGGAFPAVAWRALSPPDNARLSFRNGSDHRSCKN